MDLTEAKILKLRPKFEFGQLVTLIDWYEINQGAGFYSIRSGLNHADGVTKSPYYFSCCLGGKNAKKKVLRLFNDWWSKLEK